MRKFLLGAIIAFSLTVAAVSLWWGFDTKAELNKLREQNQEFIAETEPAGGAETAVETPNVSTGFLFPIHPDDYLMLTSAYGLRVSPLIGVEMAHQGVDIAAVWRAQVVAIADGVVVDHYPPPGTRTPRGGVYRGHEVFGGMVKIRHEGGVESLYAHLSMTRAHIGRTVRAGEVIGRVGETGRAKGEHLHLSIFVGGKNVNPLHYIGGME